MTSFCGHEGTFSSPGAIQINSQQGPIILIPIICSECGAVNLRFPMINESDEQLAAERNAKQQRIMDLTSGTGPGAHVPMESLKKGNRK